MKNNIRWLLTEAKISGLNPDVINYENGKLICYHLTSHKKWAQYNEWVEESLRNPTIEYPKQERSADDSRATRILKNLKDANRFATVNIHDIEETVIMDMIDDPYTDTSGFTPGQGDWHGKGLYTCYKFNPKIARNYGDICLVFEVDIRNFIITFEDLAKKVHGKNWQIKDQLLKLYKRKPRKKESLQAFLKLINRIESSELVLNKTIDKMSPFTSQVSYALLKTFEKEFVSSIYDGIIFLGQGDGPVCASFYPKYDAKLIGLGRLSSKTAKAEVDWYDSLNDFLGGRARNKLDFETMNEIAEENTSLSEKAEMKESERVFYDAKFSYVLTTLNNIFESKEKVKNLVEFYEEIKNSGDQDDLKVIYKVFSSGKFIQAYKEFDNISQEIVQKYRDLIEETYQVYKNDSSKDIDNFYYNIGFVMGYIPNIKFSDDLLINGVYNANRVFFTGENDNEDHFNAHSAAVFLKSAKKYIKNQNLNGEFTRLIQELENTYGLDIKIKTGNWIELIEIYEKSDQEDRNKIINLPERVIEKHPLKPMSIPDENGNFVEVHYYKSKEIIDKFCNIIDIIIKKRNINVLDSLQHAFKYVEYPLSDIIVKKCVNELLAIIGINAKKRKAAFLFEYFNKFSGSHSSDTLQKFKTTYDQVMELETKDFNKLIDNLEKKTKSQGGLLDFYNMYYNVSKKTYFDSQPKTWHENLINLIIENVKHNKKFSKLKQNTVFLIVYSINSHDIVLSEQNQILLANAADKESYWLLDYKHISQNTYANIMIPFIQNKKNTALNATQLSVNLFKNLYRNKIFLDAFIQYSDNSYFKRTLNRLIAPLKNEKIDLIIDSLNFRHGESENIEISNVIDPNDIEWFNYLLEEIRTKTDSGKTKKAVKLFKEFDDLMAQKNISRDINDSQLDLEHRKIVGNTLKEVYSL